VLRNGNRNKLHEKVAQRIATESITLVRNHGDMLPLRSVRYRKVVVMSPSGEFANKMDKTKDLPRFFGSRIDPAGPGVPLRSSDWSGKGAMRMPW